MVMQDDKEGNYFTAPRSRKFVEMQTDKDGDVFQTPEAV